MASSEHSSQNNLATTKTFTPSQILSDLLVSDSGSPSSEMDMDGLFIRSGSFNESEATESSSTTPHGRMYDKRPVSAHARLPAQLQKNAKTDFFPVPPYGSGATARSASQNQHILMPDSQNSTQLTDSAENRTTTDGQQPNNNNPNQIYDAEAPHLSHHLRPRSAPLRTPHRQDSFGITYLMSNTPADSDMPIGATFGPPITAISNKPLTATMIAAATIITEKQHVQFSIPQSQSAAPTSTSSDHARNTNSTETSNPVTDLLRKHSTEPDTVQSISQPRKRSITTSTTGIFQPVLTSASKVLFVEPSNKLAENPQKVKSSSSATKPRGKHAHVQSRIALYRQGKLGPQDFKPSALHVSDPKPDEHMPHLLSLHIEQLPWVRKVLESAGVANTSFNDQHESYHMEHDFLAGMSRSSSPSWRSRPTTPSHQSDISNMQEHLNNAYLNRGHAINGRPRSYSRTQSSQGNYMINQEKLDLGGIQMHTSHHQTSTWSLRPKTAGHRSIVSLNDQYECIRPTYDVSSSRLPSPSILISENSRRLVSAQPLSVGKAKALNNLVWMHKLVLDGQIPNITEDRKNVHPLQSGSPEILYTTDPSSDEASDSNFPIAADSHLTSRAPSRLSNGWTPALHPDNISISTRAETQPSPTPWSEYENSEIGTRPASSRPRSGRRIVTSSANARSANAEQSSSARRAKSAGTERYGIQAALRQQAIQRQTQLAMMQRQMRELQLQNPRPKSGSTRAGSARPPAARPKSSPARLVCLVAKRHNIEYSDTHGAVDADGSAWSSDEQTSDPKTIEHADQSSVDNDTEAAGNDNLTTESDVDSFLPGHVEDHGEKYATVFLPRPPSAKRVVIEVPTQEKLPACCKSPRRPADMSSWDMHERTPLPSCLRPSSPLKIPKKSPLIIPQEHDSVFAQQSILIGRSRPSSAPPIELMFRDDSGESEDGHNHSQNHEKNQELQNSTKSIYRSERMLARIASATRDRRRHGSKRSSGANVSTVTVGAVKGNVMPLHQKNRAAIVAMSFGWNSEQIDDDPVVANHDE